MQSKSNNLSLIIVMVLSMILGLLVGIIISLDINTSKNQSSVNSLDNKYYKELVYGCYERYNECPECGYKLNYKYYPLNNEYMQNKLLELGEDSDIFINNTESSQP